MRISLSALSGHTSIDSLMRLAVKFTLGLIERSSPMSEPLEAILIRDAPDAILFADRDGIIRLWNRGAEALLGYSAAEAIGQSLNLIVPESSREAHWAGFSRAVEQGRFASDAMLQTSRALTKDGNTLTVELSAAIVRDETGAVQGILAIGRDVTKRSVRREP